MPVAGIGHNRDQVRIRVTVRLFNSLTRFAPPDGPDAVIELDAGVTVGDVIRRLKLPRHDIFLVMRNGRDVSPGIYGAVNEEAALEDGDVVAFSGPVPYSWGYGAPVV